MALLLEASPKLLLLIGFIGKVYHNDEPVLAICTAITAPHYSPLSPKRCDGGYRFSHVVLPGDHHPAPLKK